MNLEEERDALRRELIGTQEMLAFVLQSVGEPVYVDKADVMAKLPENIQIAVDDDIAGDRFVFYLARVE